MNKKVIYYILFACLNVIVINQPILSQDASILTFQEYINNVGQYHPLALRTDLDLDMANTEMKRARGNFDPTINTSWYQKEFDDKRYFQEIKGDVIIPTRLGLNVIAGYKNNDGDFLNNSDFTDPRGQLNIGIEANLLKGLLIDEARAELALASIGQDVAVNRRAVELNNLLYLASAAYVDWVWWQGRVDVARRNVQRAQRYLSMTKETFKGGDATAIDTLEAFMLLQENQSIVLIQEAGLQKARLNLENFLWDQQGIKNLAKGQRPEERISNQLNTYTQFMMDSILNQHPALITYDLKRQALKVKEQLKRDKLKPGLKLQLNALSGRNNDLLAGYNPQDYLAGLNFSMPVFWRKERSEVEKVEIQTKQNEIDRINKEQTLINKIENAIFQLENISLQIDIVQENLMNAEVLLEAEESKFSFGESSVFLINKRQEKVLEKRFKLKDYEAKYQKEQLKLIYLSNRSTTMAPI